MLLSLLQRDVGWCASKCLSCPAGLLRPESSSHIRFELTRLCSESLLTSVGYFDWRSSIDSNVQVHVRHAPPPGPKLDQSPSVWFEACFPLFPTPALATHCCLQVQPRPACAQRASMHRRQTPSSSSTSSSTASPFVPVQRNGTHPHTLHSLRKGPTDPTGASRQPQRADAERDRHQQEGQELRDAAQRERARQRAIGAQLEERYAQEHGTTNRGPPPPRPPRPPTPRPPQGTRS